MWRDVPVARRWAPVFDRAEARGRTADRLYSVDRHRRARMIELVLHMDDRLV